MIEQMISLDPVTSAILQPARFSTFYILASAGEKIHARQRRAASARAMIITSGTAEIKSTGSDRETPEKEAASAPRSSGKTSCGIKASFRKHHEKAQQGNKQETDIAKERSAE